MVAPLFSPTITVSTVSLQGHFTPSTSMTEPPPEQCHYRVYQWDHWRQGWCPETTVVVFTGQPGHKLCQDPRANQGLKDWKKKTSAASCPHGDFKFLGVQNGWWPLVEEGTYTYSLRTHTQKQLGCSAAVLQPMFYWDYSDLLNGLPAGSKQTVNCFRDSPPLGRYPTGSTKH